jgi:hypothetical protein
VYIERTFGRAIDNYTYHQIEAKIAPLRVHLYAMRRIDMWTTILPKLRGLILFFAFLVGFCPLEMKKRFAPGPFGPAALW